MDTLIPKLPQIPSFDFLKPFTENMNSSETSNLWNSLNKSVPKSVLVLGNGFDIDLGMKTRYEQFVKSTDWPFDKSNNYDETSLPYFLNQYLGSIDTWYDLEEALAKFAKKSAKQLTNKEITNTKEDFAILCHSLESYLQKQEDTFIQQMKVSGTRLMKPAHCFLQYFLKKEIRSIYTFNYTSVRRIANTLGLDFHDKYTHIHGSLEKSNIILGAGDQRELDDNYFDFFKSANPSYESNNLVEDLNTADEVYIFGHSLGLNDHDYFSEFFKMAASKSAHRINFSEKIKLRIFTYDAESEIAVKKQLMDLTEKHLIGLYAHCNFKILKTCKQHQDEWMLDDDSL